MRPYATSVCGLKLLVYEALSYSVVKPVTVVGGGGEAADVSDDSKRFYYRVAEGLIHE